MGFVQVKCRKIYNDQFKQKKAIKSNKNLNSKTKL